MCGCLWERGRLARGLLRKHISSIRDVFVCHHYNNTITMNLYLFADVSKKIENIYTFSGT